MGDEVAPSSFKEKNQNGKFLVFGRSFRNLITCHGQNSKEQIKLEQEFQTNFKVFSLYSLFLLFLCLNKLENEHHSHQACILLSMEMLILIATCLICYMYGSLISCLLSF